MQEPTPDRRVLLAASLGLAAAAAAAALLSLLWLEGVKRLQGR